MTIEVPKALAASHAKFFGAAGRVWIDALPRFAADCLDHWGLHRDGPAVCGAVALVLPVRFDDGTPAVLKLQPVDDETAGEPLALSAWNGDGAVRLLRHATQSGALQPGALQPGALVLERLDAGRTLGSVADDLTALRTVSELLARLTAVPAPAGLRRLGDVAAAMLDRVPAALERVADPAERWLVRRCASAVRELLPEPGDRLVHWDLHFDNVLAGDREPWLAIDPKPLAGDPGFELLSALHNRWDDVVGTGDVARAVRRRFDLMTEVLGLDRRRATGWTLGRILQNALWEAENDDTVWHTGPDRAVAAALLGTR